MTKFGSPPRLIAMVRQFYAGMQARVQNDGDYSEPNLVTNAAKQGCVIRVFHYDPELPRIATN